MSPVRVSAGGCTTFLKFRQHETPADLDARAKLQTFFKIHPHGSHRWDFAPCVLLSTRQFWTSDVDQVVCGLSIKIGSLMVGAHNSVTFHRGRWYAQNDERSNRDLRLRTRLVRSQISCCMNSALRVVITYER